MFKFLGSVIMLAAIFMVFSFTVGFGWLLGLFALMGAGIALLVAGLSTAFIFGTFWFWVLVAGAMCLTFYSIDDGDLDHYVRDDGGLGALITILVSLLVLQFFGDIHVFSYLWHHPYWSFLWALGYVGAGVFWSWVRWIIYVLNMRDRCKDELQKFYSSHRAGLKDLPKEQWTEDEKREWSYTAIERYSKKPVPRTHKHAIVKWMAYWPCSFIWTFISDLVKRFFRHLYELCERAYVWVTDKLWEDIEKNLPKK